MSINDTTSISPQKCHRKSAQSTTDDSALPLPELKGRCLKSATPKLVLTKQKQSPPLKFYINENIQKNRLRCENISDYSYVETYLEAIQRVTIEEKKQKQINMLQMTSYPAFPMLPGQIMRERIKKYSEIQQKEVMKYFVRKDSVPHKTMSKQNTIVSQKSIQSSGSKTEQLSLSLVMKNRMKHRVSAQRFMILKRNKEEINFQKIYSNQESVKCEVASITKIMTCFTTLKFLNEKKIDLECIRIKIPYYAECIEGTSAYLNAGNFLNFKQLLYALMLPSGNDAAYVLSYAIAFLKSCENISRYKNGHFIDCDLEIEKNQFNLRTTFLQMMNQNAKILKMEKTHYNSVHGLNDPLNVSCAQDIVRLIEECIKLDDFMNIVNTRSFKTNSTTENGNQSTVYKWKNTNKLLKKEGWEGIKTGITTNAGPCFSGYYRNDNFDAIVVVLHSSNMQQRFKDAENLVGLL